MKNIQLNALLILLTLTPLLGFTQAKVEHLDIDVILENAVESSQQGNFEKTLEILNNVSKNDSAYCSVLTSKSYYLLNLEKYDEAIKIADEGLSGSCDNEKLYFYMNKGAALASQENYKAALKTYNKGLESHPKNYKLWYNKGISLENTDKLEEAIDAYKKAIFYRPSYPKPHLQLGNICYRQGKIAQALMCFNMYLLLDPDSEGSFNTLKSLNDIISSENENSYNDEIQISEDDEAFEELNLIIDNKIALNKKYKIENEIDIALVRQNHALLEQLKEFEGNSGFWEKKYVAFYNWINENNLFDNFTYTLNASIQNPKYKKVIDKNIKNISSFKEQMLQKWMQILQEGTINNPDKSFYYNNNYLQAYGKLKDGNTIGDWVFYDSNGRITGKGNFNNEGKRDNNWKWYYANGNVKETAQYTAGVLEGAYITYHENGKENIKTSYANDKLDGEYTIHNSRGALTQKKYFKEDLLEGTYQAYFNVGEDLIEYKTPITKDNAEGIGYEYFSNGDIFAERNFKNGELHGLESLYYNNNKIRAEINYSNGKYHGSYKTYHVNGQLAEIGQSIEGVYDGLWKTYYPNGNLESEFNYVNGKIDGIYKYFTPSGLLNYEYEYRKGLIIAYKFYNDKGEIIKEDRKKGGEFLYKSYSIDGNLTSEGLYDIKGGKKGEWKFYSNNGILTSKGTYIDNETNGEYTNYHNNGEKSSVFHYKNGTIIDYGIDYHLNGKIKAQGWYKEGAQNGEWHSYYLNGNIEAINFYHKGQLHGEQQYFSVDGKLDHTSHYKYDELQHERYYTIDSTLLEEVNYIQDKSDYQVTFKHFNNKNNIVIDYKNGLKHGKYVNFDFYGNKYIEGTYLNNSAHDEWKWYHENGKVKIQLNYLNGNLDGKYLRYYDNGILEDDDYYINGDAHGTWKSYYENGNLNTVTEYEYDKINGRKEFYAPDGTLQLVRIYDYGKLIGYTYLGEDGKELPIIPLKNETGLIKAFFKNGKPSREMEYINGDLSNIYKSYYISGAIESKIEYDSGEYHGLNLEYYENGNVKNERHYSHGDLNGTHKSYYENGKLKKEINYLNDEKHGEVKYYDKSGKLTKTEYYFNGAIYKVETN